MRRRRAWGGCLVVATLAVAIGAGCNHREDDGSIKPVSERSAPAPTIETNPVPAPTPPPESVANPLKMTLKGEAEPAPAPVGSVDPCALPEPTGPLAMKLRHDKPNAPGQRNPLCMHLK